MWFQLPLLLRNRKQVGRRPRRCRLWVRELGCFEANTGRGKFSGQGADHRLRGEQLTRKIAVRGRFDGELILQPIVGKFELGDPSGRFGSSRGLSFSKSASEGRFSALVPFPIPDCFQRIFNNGSFRTLGVGIRQRKFLRNILGGEEAIASMSKLR